MIRPASARRILVLEDEILYLHLIVAACERVGFEPISARTVDEAVALMEELQTVDLNPLVVDAVWIDHFLPEKNGIELV
jgi:DNA-binding response OmpR family regulator